MEALMNELECAICLNTLDETCRVLPCQHTFCRRCLEDILHSKKELRCPECRVLVDTKIEDLPPNVLLMRILERLKTKPTTETGNATTRPVSTTETKESQAKALFDYESTEAGDLCFKAGEVLTLKRRIDKNWYFGEVNGKTGTFPANHVQVMVPLPAALCKALYDFQMKEEEREGCLMFTRGTTIHVLRRVDQNWAEGRINNSIGIFPISFVELNPMAKQLLDFAVTRSSPRADKMRTPPNPPGAIAPSSATVEGVRKPVEKSTPSKRIPGTGSVRDVQKFMQPCIALYPYEPQKPDELELKKGCVYYILEKCQDGWFKGMSRQFAPGVFPGNYVAMIKSKEHLNSEAFQKMMMQQSSEAQQTTTINPPTLPERDTQRSSTPNSSLNSSLNSTLNVTPSDTSKDDKPATKDDSTIGLLKRFTKNALSSSARAGPAQLKKAPADVNNAPVHTRSGSCPSQLPQANPARVVKETGFLTSRPAKFTTEKSSSSQSNLPPTTLCAPPSALTYRHHKKSFSLDSTSTANASSKPNKVERYQCIETYPPSSDFELELNRGDTIMVSKKRENGWYKGQHERTGKIGLFPASFVARVDE